MKIRVENEFGRELEQIDLKKISQAKVTLTIIFVKKKKKKKVPVAACYRIGLIFIPLKMNDSKLNSLL